MVFCCLTEAQVQQLVENIYEICDCCENDIYNDDLTNDDDLSIDDIENFYE